MSARRGSYRRTLSAAWLACVLFAAGCAQLDPEAELAAAAASLAAGNYSCLLYTSPSPRDS